MILLQLNFLQALNLQYILLIKFIDLRLYLLFYVDFLLYYIVDLLLHLIKIGFNDLGLLEKVPTPSSAHFEFATEEELAVTNSTRLPHFRNYLNITETQTFIHAFKELLALIGEHSHLSAATFAGSMSTELAQSDLVFILSFSL